MKKTLAILTLLLSLVSLGDGAYPVLMRQDITFTSNKWQLVYLTVAPTGTADQVFADWPADTIARYDADSFRRYEQGSSTSTTKNEWVRPPAMLVWHRGDAGASEFSGLLANAAYLLLPNRNRTVSVLGSPEAARITWHATDTNTLANYVGFSIQSGVSVKAADYFEGCTAGITALKKVGGSKESGPTETKNLWGDNTVMATNGLGIAVESANVSDWSGVLYVTPQYGVDFGTNLVQSTVSVRNDGTEARTVQLTFRRGEALDDFHIPALRLDAFLWKDSSVLGSEWTAFNAKPLTKKLAAGETWTLKLAFDRTLTADVTAGHVLGGLFEFTDLDGKSKMRTVIPVSATADGGAWAKTAWPRGLWLMNVSFDRASQIVTSGTDASKSTLAHGLAAGGAMSVRLPVLVRDSGTAYLLQRVMVMTDTNGTTRLFSGKASVPDRFTFTRRISTAFLPTDQPVIATESGETQTFGSEMSFAFTIAEHSPLNPLRHAQHPLHDGLSADYKSKAPSGDTFANYRYETKPELFSIGNQIRILWDDSSSATAWSPEEKMTGTCDWTFSNLVKEGNLRVTGSFTMTRVSSSDVTLY